MYFVGFLFLIAIFIIILFAVGVIPSKVCYDYDSPLNFFVYQEPSASYSDELVNLWVSKTWRNDGRRIPCRLETCAKPNPDKKLIIYSHGNAENLLLCSQFVRELAANLDSDVVAYDYSGYGLNDFDKFERTPEGINMTLQCVLDHLWESHGYSPTNTLIWGYSLGTGVSTYMASKLSKQSTPPRGLVLFGAYSSILDVVKDHVHPEIAKWFQERWDNKEAIRSVTCPILLMHGQSDSLIKVSHAETLAKANPRAKLYIHPNTGHTKFHFGETVKEVKKWLTNLQI